MDAVAPAVAPLPSVVDAPSRGVSVTMNTLLQPARRHHTVLELPPDRQFAQVGKDLALVQPSRATVCQSLAARRCSKIRNSHRKDSLCNSHFPRNLKIMHHRCRFPILGGCHKIESTVSLKKKRPQGHGATAPRFQSSHSRAKNSCRALSTELSPSKSSTSLPACRLQRGIPSLRLSQSRWGGAVDRPPPQSATAGSAGSSICCPAVAAPELLHLMVVLVIYTVPEAVGKQIRDAAIVASGSRQC